MSTAATLPCIRVGGVPEHFNLPWRLACADELFELHGVKVVWRDYELGTGALLSALRSGEIDVIIALTEGLISAISTDCLQSSSQQSSIRLLGTYVESPLCWAISTGAESRIENVEELRYQKIGISRLGSGSHLMSCVLASQRGWQQEDLHYEIEGSFKQLRESVNAQRTQAFMWETFTTKPFHDSHEVKRIGEITTPWSCFLIASKQEVGGLSAHA